MSMILNINNKIAGSRLLSAKKFYQAGNWPGAG
jgi:hypothetical protein